MVVESGKDRPVELALSNNVNTLYTSSAESVFGLDMTPRVATFRVNHAIIANMRLRKMPRGPKSSPTVSQIRAFDPANLTDHAAPYSLISDGVVLDWGLRNSVGVGEHPVTTGIYGVDDSVDGVKRNGHDVHENNPVEEFNVFGYLNGTVMANQGANIRYPRCFAVWQVDKILDNDGLVITKQISMQENTTLQDGTCASDYIPPD
ncbi:uncharacterized protein B0H64DRAFT_377951 [Chaetomium fimeti]|uniref:Pyrroloquinoline quinone-dependent pyranose dehydrogenase beta-propeller domain-containing protein n=1 Tax=Chaetomium fimeti TaxID=1854472 RepID=A0AAE0H754_9PEZI|nr:hypothetical protein B0H64DRAFT_377951 [Chaetomium fimeti]